MVQLNKLVLILLFLLAARILHFNQLSVFDSRSGTGSATISVDLQKKTDTSISFDKAASAAPTPIATTTPIPAPTPAVAYHDWVKLQIKSDIRTLPDLNKPVVLEANAGDSFPSVKTSGDWIEIQLGEKQFGWVPVSKVKIVPMDSSLVQLVQAAKDTPLYRGPDQSFGQAHGFPSGAALVPNFISGQWVRLAKENVWARTDQVKWTAGDPPASAAWANEGKMLSDQTSAQLPLKDKTIVVDPGHGGSDPGAIATTRPIYERDVNLAAAQVLSEKLKAAGAHVIMTRTTNDVFVSLSDRASLSNQNKADVFVSIHQNMFAQDPAVSGTITYYDTAISKSLAEDIEASTTKELNSRQEKTHIEEEQLYVLSHNQRPAVLVEGCFLSNPKELDESLLPDYQEKLAKGIYEGILKYLGSK